MPKHKRRKDDDDDDHHDDNREAQPSNPILARRQRRRLQCRRNQRRYRDKQVSQEYNLLLDVNELRGQVAQLEIHKSLLQHRRQLMPPTNSLVSKILKYYELFRFGLAPAPCLPSANARTQLYEQQVAYYHSMTADRIERGNESVSPNVVLELWKRITRYQPEYEMTVLGCELIDTPLTPIVRVDALMKYRITRTTMANLFPHVLQNEWLVQLLVGKKLECRMSCDYVFDAHQRLFQHSIHVETLLGLQKLLKKLDITLEVMQHALITDNYFVGKWSDNKEAEVDLTATVGNGMEGEEAAKDEEGKAAAKAQEAAKEKQEETDHLVPLPMTKPATTPVSNLNEPQAHVQPQQQPQQHKQHSLNPLSIRFLLS